MNTLNLNALIVEDEAIFSALLRSKLDALVNNVYTAENAQQGLAMLKLANPDIVFMDNFLPGKDGIESLAQFKKDSPKSQLVIMSSALDFSALSEATENEVDYLLNKKQNVKAVLQQILATCSSKKLIEEELGHSSEFEEKSVLAPKRIAIIKSSDSMSNHISWFIDNLSSETTITHFTRLDEFVEALVKENKYDFVFSGVSAEDGDLIGIMPMIKAKVPFAHVLVYSETAELDEAIALINSGASRFLEKSDQWEISLVNTLRKLDLF